jgi:flagellar motor switch protein FliG
MGYFNDRLRQDVILRIATLDGVKPLALKELNEVLTKLLSGNENLNKKQIGGIRAAAEIMNFMNGENEASMMEGIKAYDADMAQKIMDEMFIFDDIIQVDDKGIQTILREVQSESLIKNMSSRAAEMMKEDLETKGPIKLSEVEAQQKQILQIVRRLADEGQLMLGGKGGDDQYV